MPDNLDERLKEARVKMPQKAHDRIDGLLDNLPKKAPKRSYVKPILTAVAAALLIFFIITFATPEGRARAGQIIEWFYNAVFVHGTPARSDGAVPSVEGSRTYENADDLLSDSHTLLLTTEDDNPLELSVEGDMVRIESFYGDIRVYQHVTYDGKSYEHRVYSDKNDNDEPYSIKVGELELNGFVSDNGSYLVGSLYGVWYEVNTDTAGKAEFTAFTKTLVLKKGGAH